MHQQQSKFFVIELKKGWGTFCEFLSSDKCFCFLQCFDWLDNRNGIWPIKTCATYPEGFLLEELA